MQRITKDLFAAGFKNWAAEIGRADDGLPSGLGLSVSGT